MAIFAHTHHINHVRDALSHHYVTPESVGGKQLLRRPMRD